MRDPRPTIDRSDYFTTAHQYARVLRQAADDHFDDPDKWLCLTDAADRYAAMPPLTPIPLF